jgi:hypothetical protein
MLHYQKAVYLFRVFFYPELRHSLAFFANPSQVVRKFAKKPKRNLRGVPKKLRTKPCNGVVVNGLSKVCLGVFRCVFGSAGRLSWDLFGFSSAFFGALPGKPEQFPNNSQTKPKANPNGIGTASE